MLSLDRILSSRSLPSLPSVAVKLLELSRDPTASTTTFVQTVQSDPAIAAKILKLSNSTFLGIRSNVTTVQRAVTLMGTQSVTALALGFSIARQSCGSGPVADAFSDYWQRSVLQAIACETQVDEQKEHTRSELFLAGLMLDIGQLAMLRTIGKEYASLLIAGKSSGSEPITVLEREAFGFDHAEVGGRLLQQWRFPEMLIEATRRHHDSDVEEIRRITESDQELGSLLATTRIASAAGDYFYGGDVTRGLETVQQACREGRGYSDARTLDYCEAVSDAFRENADIFEANADTLPEPSELMAAANEELAAAAVSAQMDHHRSAAAIEGLEAEREQLARENESLRQRTSIDPLTGCYNRTHFGAALAAEVKSCRSTATPLAVFFADIDKFKQINDTHGHQFGDDVLQAVAGLLRGGVQPGDVVARFGGEEFVGLIRDPTEAGLRKVVEHLRAVTEQAVFEIDGQRIPVTVSIGAVFTVPCPRETELEESLIRDADAAMYEAKNAGRNRTVVRNLLSEEEQSLLNRAMKQRFSLWLLRNQHLSVAEVSAALTASVRPQTPIGEVAVKYNFMSARQVERVLQKQESEGNSRRFGEVAVGCGFLPEDSLAGLLAIRQEDPRALARELILVARISPETMALHLNTFLKTLPTAQKAVAEPALC